MRRSIALFAFIALFVMAAAGFAQAADPPASSSIKGLSLVTDYPSQTVRAGEITTIRVKLTNSGLPPEPVALSLSDVPAGWKVDILGGGQSVASSMPGINQDIKVKVTPPRDVKAGDYPVLVKVASEGATAELRVTLQISGQGKLALSTKDGRLSGEAEVGKPAAYTLVVSNDGTAPIEEVEMAGTVPANW